MDIKTWDKDGNWDDVEIQINEQKYYGKRAIFYQSELYSKEITEGESYDNLRKTIIINILDFNCFKDNRYFRRYSYNDFETNQFYKELDFADLYFIELRKFDNDLEKYEVAHITKGEILLKQGKKNEACTEFNLAIQLGVKQSYLAEMMKDCK